MQEWHSSGWVDWPEQDAPQQPLSGQEETSWPAVVADGAQLPVQPAPGPNHARPDTLEQAQLEALGVPLGNAPVAHVPNNPAADPRRTRFGVELHILDSLDDIIQHLPQLQEPLRTALTMLFQQIHRYLTAFVNGQPPAMPVVNERLARHRSQALTDFLRHRANYLPVSMPELMQATDMSEDIIMQTIVGNHRFETSVRYGVLNVSALPSVRSRRRN